MKVDKLIVIISNKSGSCYQVALTESQRRIVENYISLMHDGTIKVSKPKLGLKIGAKK